MLTSAAHLVRPAGCSVQVGPPSRAVCSVVRSGVDVLVVLDQGARFSGHLLRGTVRSSLAGEMCISSFTVAA